MTAFVVLVGAAAVSWGLRVLFIAVVPPERLPASARGALAHTGTVVLAALIASELGRPAVATSALSTSDTMLALAVAAVVAWRRRHLGATVGTALAVAWALSAIG